MNAEDFAGRPGDQFVLPEVAGSEGIVRRLNERQTFLHRHGTSGRLGVLDAADVREFGVSPDLVQALSRGYEACYRASNSEDALRRAKKSMARVSRRAMARRDAHRCSTPYTVGA